MSEGGRGAPQASLSGALASLEARAVPNERSGGGVPAGDGVVEPGDQVVLGLRLLSVEGAADDDPLDGLGHVQPGAADRRVERHHAVVEQPADDRPAQVAGQVIPDQEHTEWRQGLGRLMTEPGSPSREWWPLVLGERQDRQARQHLGQLGLEPRMEDDVRRVGDALGAQFTGGRAEQRQQLGGPAAHVLMRLTRGRTDRCPGGPRLRDRLVRTGLVLAPDGQPRRFG
jgi:hypothetical protein